MAYEFIKMDNEHKYRLVSKGWLWDSPQDVYLDNPGVGKLELCATYQGRTVNSKYTSSLEANQLMEILRKMGLKTDELQKVKFPDTASQKTLTEWDHLITWLLTARNRI